MNIKIRPTYPLFIWDFWQKKIGKSGIKKFATLNPTFGLISSLYFKIRVILTLWLPELTKTILSVGSLVVSTLEQFLFTMLQNFGKYAPNLPIPPYFVPNNLQIYFGCRLGPPPMLEQISKFFWRHPLLDLLIRIKVSLLFKPWRSRKCFILMTSFNLKNDDILIC